jgi:hypothetical protein
MTCAYSRGRHRWQHRTAARPDDVETYRRSVPRRATSGFTPDERDEHIRNVTAMIVEAKVRGSLVNRETWRLT